MIRGDNILYIGINVFTLYNKTLLFDFLLKKKELLLLTFIKKTKCLLLLNIFSNKWMDSTDEFCQSSNRIFLRFYFRKNKIKSSDDIILSKNQENAVKTKFRKSY